MVTDEDNEKLSDSLAKASFFLRQLKKCGWVENEIGNDQKFRVIMPNHAVEMLRTFEIITGGQETEYQSKIAAVYSTLNNLDLMRDPYPLVIKPVYDLTEKTNTLVQPHIVLKIFLSLAQG